MPHTVSFDVSKKDFVLIERIATRATRLAERATVTYSVLDAQMDLTACHANGCPLRLPALFLAGEFDFLHDVLGIRRHLNRRTGKLENHFWPRSAVKED